MLCLRPDLGSGLCRGDVGSWVRTAAMAAALAVLPLILAPGRTPTRQNSGSPPQAHPHASCQISSSQPCSTTKQFSRDNDDAQLQSRGTPASHQTGADPAALGGANPPNTTEVQVHGREVHGRGGDSSLRQRQDGCEPPQAASGQQGQPHSGASSSTCNSSAEHAETCSAVAAALCKQAVERIARVREVRCDYGPRLALADTLVLACPKKKNLSAPSSRSCFANLLDVRIVACLQTAWWPQMTMGPSGSSRATSASLDRLRPICCLLPLVHAQQGTGC